MNFSQLPDSYKYDTLAQAIYARELELFHYDFDRCNFEYLIEHSTDESFKKDVFARLSETIKQIDNVNLILKALWAQVDNAEAYDAAVKKAVMDRRSKESQ